MKIQMGVSMDLHRNFYTDRLYLSAITKKYVNDNARVSTIDNTFYFDSMPWSLFFIMLLIFVEIKNVFLSTVLMRVKLKIPASSIFSIKRKIRNLNWYRNFDKVVFSHLYLFHFLCILIYRGRNIHIITSAAWNPNKCVTRLTKTWISTKY